MYACLSGLFIIAILSCSEAEFIKEIDGNPKLEFPQKSTLGRKGGTQVKRIRGNVLSGFDNNVKWALEPPNSANKTKIAFITTTSEHPDKIILWMEYHRAIGVSLFYLFTEGVASSNESMEILSKEPGVSIVPRDDNLTAIQSTSRAWRENWLAAFFNKPCNHELFVKQSLNMEIGIVFGIEDEADWILHIDTDELIYPAGSLSYSLTEILDTVPDDVDLFIFPNYESLAQTTDVSDPFLEVTLFKKNYAHVNSKEYFSKYGVVQRGNPNYFTTYGNGKSAARVVNGLRPNGAHRWYNYFKTPKEWSSRSAAVLHYTYNRFADLKSRRDRCDCAPTKEDAKKCFILDFDRIAFMEASLKNDEELMQFFKDRLVWDNAETVTKLVNIGLFGRIYEPQLLLRGIKEALRQKKSSTESQL